MKKKLTKYRHFLAAPLCGLLAVCIVLSGLLYTSDNRVADALYQTPQALDGSIVIIGIDAKSIQDLGPYNTWTRDVIASCIETLNQDPDNRPAAIGVDVLYAGASNSASDAHLAAAAADGGNVVVACAANFNTVVTAQQTLNTRNIASVDLPYAALRQSALLGHINGMYDRDGVLRHSLLYLDDGQTSLPSFSLALYRLWAQQNGVTAEAPQTDSQGFWYVDFAAKPGGFYDGYGVSGLLDGVYDPSLFAGKVVLIGPWAAGLSDSFVTAVSRDEQMYGVEYQANCLYAMMHGQGKTQVSAWLQYAILFVLITGCVLFFHRRRLRWCLIGWAGLSALWLLACVIAYQAGVVLHPLWTPLFVTAVFIGSLAANYVTEFREKRALKRTFQRYVAPEVVEQLLRDPQAAQLGGREAEIAVLFVDIRGFTRLSESMTPTQVVQVLNEFLSLITDCVLRNHGTLDKFIGDCAMAIWNAPLPQADYQLNACRAALEMAAGAGALRERLKKQYGSSVGFGMGVHCGRAVVGNVGSSLRMDYTAIGDTVNTASRLESIAPADTVYISRAVADALAGRIQCTPLDAPVQLKGKAEGFEVLILNSITETAPAARTPAEQKPAGNTKGEAAK